jgi:hypothetical protein
MRKAADRLEQHGDPTDAADPNGSTCARLKWWQDRADELHDQLARVQTDADEWRNMAHSRKLQADKASRRLETERALADRLAAPLMFNEGEVESMQEPTFTKAHVAALAAWKEARHE